MIQDYFKRTPKKKTKTKQKSVEYRQIRENSSKTLAYRKTAELSKGELKIANFLKEQKVHFISEYFFRDLFNRKSKNLLYYDFYIPFYNLCIEFDGKQHYDKNKSNRRTENDFLKTAYCIKNKIHFLRIKYTDFENIERLICEKMDKISPVI